MIAADPQTTSHDAGSPHNQFGWASKLGPNRGAFGLLGAVLAYLLFALAWNASGRRDADFARSAAFVATCGASAGLIVCIQAIFAERSARHGWIGLAAAFAAATASAVASMYAVWSDGAVFWRPATLRWLETGGAFALVAGAVILLNRRPINRMLLRELTALLVVTMLLWTLVVLGIAQFIVESPPMWSLLTLVLSLSFSSSGLVVALNKLRSTEPEAAVRTLGIALVAAIWTAILLLVDFGGLARTPGIVGLARWLVPIATLGVSAAAVNQRHLLGASFDQIQTLEFPKRIAVSPSRLVLLGTGALVGVAVAARALGATVSADLAAIAGCAVLLQLVGLGLDLMIERDRVSVLLDSAEQLERLANIDLLTQLPNRAALESRLAEEMERAIRYEQPLSVCFVDIDHFKSINDRFGHRAGDLVLRDVADSLDFTARSIDYVGRYGGEEFIVIAPGTWSADALVLGERLRAQLEKLDFEGVDDEPLKLTISVGIAGFPEHADSLPLLMERADAALYHSKASGRNRVTLWRIESDD
jgi:diguanylate cyclase (GGDEF)-like protein